ncbi:hypothetical protein LCGC14_0567250 [marine sediment metagenome]|uniref:Uncharacterized protein n=1 Tax=marine sediment metagenome TaxID=412755 RepID=A0A0F9UTH5_9ZZZZ
MAVKTGGGIGILWEAEHRDGDGNLISRQASISVPVQPTCIKPSCLLKYLYQAITYVLICSYHARRTAFAESHRNTKILERYRTGEPSPKTMWQAIHANIKLACPICRKYNVDPLSGRR